MPSLSVVRLNVPAGKAAPTALLSPEPPNLTSTPFQYSFSSAGSDRCVMPPVSLTDALNLGPAFVQSGDRLPLTSIDWTKTPSTVLTAVTSVFPEIIAFRTKLLLTIFAMY